MVESMANSVEDYLIDGLSFKLKPGASYVNERKSVTYHPQGSNIYTPAGGTKLIKVLLTGDQWLDPSTVRVVFDLVNTGTGSQVLRPLGGPHTFFRRMRVLCNGQIVEDIDDYNRVHEMFLVLSPKETRVNNKVEAFGRDWDLEDYNATTLKASTFPGIAVGKNMTVLFKPLSGLLDQPKYIPLRYCPLTIELELVNDATEPVVSGYGVALNTGDVVFAGSDFSGTNNSLSWAIENVMVKCDICTLDNGLDNSYAEHLLSGKSLPINYNTYVSQMQSLVSSAGVGQDKVRLNVTRALSRLKSVFVTLFRSADSLTSAPGANVMLVGRKRWNTFYSPKYYGKFESDREFEFQLQLGSKLYPEYPIRSHAESFYQLRKTIGAHNNKHNTMNVSWPEYRETKLIIGTDTEKVLEAGFTGANTRAGDILNIRFDNRSTNTLHWAHEMHIILHSDNIMEIRDSGVTIFD